MNRDELLLHKVKITWVIVLLVPSIIYLGIVFLLLPEHLLHVDFQQWFLYFFPKVVPIMVFAFYLLINPVPKMFKHIFWGTIATAGATALLITICALAYGSQLVNGMLTGIYNWSVWGWLTWNYAFVVLGLMSFYKTAKPLFSLTYAVIGVTAGSILYEIPVCWRDLQAYAHYTYPFTFATSWLCIAFLTVLMIQEKWRPNKLFLLALAFYLFGSVAYIVYGNALMWLPRIPTVLLLTVIPSGFRMVKT